MSENQTVFDIKTLILNEFSNDPVYRLAVLNDLEDHLFTKEILSMHHEINYSTVDAGKIIGRADSTIRNHFRSDLLKYINPEKYGKYYRLNFVSIFKLHLIFLLIEKASKTSIDILVELGIQPASIEYDTGFEVPKKNHLQPSNRSGNSGDYELEGRLDELEKNFKIQSIMLSLLKYEKDLSDVDREIEVYESKIENVQTNAHMKYLEESQTQMLALSLKNPTKKRSLFDSIFKKNNDTELNVMELSKEIEKKLKEKMKEEMKSKIGEYEEKLKEAREKQIRLKELHQHEEKKFKALSGEPSKQNLLDNSTNS
jgi:hypothetical protein